MNEEKKHNHIMADNSGFTLVELLVSMAILGVVFIPILRSFMAATLTNSKAQRIQNATSVAQDTMEEVKSKSITELMADPRIDAVNDPVVDENGNEVTNAGKVAYIHYKYSNVTNTQGEKFDVDVLVEAAPYSQDKASIDPADEKGIIDANKKELPMLKDVNPDTCIALSGEINRYDNTAVDTLLMRYTEATIDKATIQKYGVKTVEIDITDPTDLSKTMSEYKCNVTYSLSQADSSSIPRDESITYLVQSGTVTNHNISNGPDIYLFYSMMKDCATEHLGSEKITVKQNTGSLRTHKLNLIMQHNRLYKNAVPAEAVAVDPSLNSIADALDDSGDFIVLNETMKTNDTFGTNFSSNIVDAFDSTDTPMYINQKKIRLYNITVKVSQTVNGEEKTKAELKSTMEAK